MLLAAVTVLVVVTGEPDEDAFGRAVQRALRTSLGPETVVLVRRAQGETDDDLAAWAAQEHASLLGVVTWSDGQHRATIRFIQPSDGRWGNREIRFDTADAAGERGRTVGFALASVVPDDATRETRETPPSPPPSPPSPSEPPLAATSAERPPSPSAPAPPGRYMLEAAAQVASGVGGYGGGIGGTFGARFALAGPFCLRLTAGARGGDIDPAAATSRVLFAGAGVAWQPWLDAGRRWSAGVRLDALVVGHQIVHFDPDDTSPVSRFRLLPGADLALEGAWRFAGQAAFVVALGSEVAFGRTDVFMLGNKVAEVSPVRALTEAGLRVSF